MSHGQSSLIQDIPPNWHPLDIMVRHGDRPPQPRPGPTPYFRGTTIPRRKCPTCQGTGINPVWMTKVCPKCNGERTVSK